MLRSQRICYEQRGVPRHVLVMPVPDLLESVVGQPISARSEFKRHGSTQGAQDQTDTEKYSNFRQDPKMRFQQQVAAYPRS